MDIERYSEHSLILGTAQNLDFNYTEFGTIKNERLINFLSKSLKLILFCFLFFSCSQLSQSQTFKVDSLIILNPDNNNVYIKLPILVGDKKISDTINQQIIEDLFFDTITTPWKENIEALIINEAEFGVWYEIIDFKVILLNERVYSIELFGEGCGAYCDNFYFSYMFDLKTGSLINSTDIFTTEGFDYFWERVIKSKNAEIEDEIKTLFKETKDISNAEELNTHNQTINLYATCLEGYSEAPSGYVSVDNRKLHVHLNRCSNHASRALDELGVFKFIFEISELEQYLSPYGKTLLLN